MKKFIKEYIFIYLLNKKIICGILIIMNSLSNAQNCQPNILLQNQALFNGSNNIYNASQTIHLAGSNTSYSINNGSKLVLNAGVEITFSNGFDAYAGSDLTTKIQTCAISDIPNDPLFSLQWGHRNQGNVQSYNNQGLVGTVGMDSKILDAWKITKGSSNIIVAVIDSGIDINHPDINKARIMDGWDFRSNNQGSQVLRSNLFDYENHGTAVTGIIAATVNNGIGIAGIDQNCRILPLIVDPGKHDQIANAIKKAVDSGAKVINMSLGGNIESSEDYKQAINYASRNNVTIVAASGNDNSNLVNYPSRFGEIISVGSANPCGYRKTAVSINNPGNCDKDYRGENPGESPWGSNYGEGLDILAPGSLLPTTDMIGFSQGYSGLNNNGQYHYSSYDNGNYITNLLGTSFAAPFVSGVVSLMLSVNQNLKPYQIQQIVKNSIITGSENMINALAAIQAAQNYNNNYVLGDWDLITDAAPFVTRDNLIDYNIKITNIGNLNLPPAELKYKLLRENNTVAYENSVTIPALNPQNIKTFSFNLPTNLDNCQIDSKVTLIAEIVNNGTIEAYQTNNISKNSVVILKRRDLQLGFINFGFFDDILKADYVIGNYGPDLAFTNLPIHGDMIRFWASQDMFLDKNIDKSFQPAISRISFSLCGNDFEDLKTISLFSIGESYDHIIIEIDPFNLVNETNESNNILVYGIDKSQARIQSIDNNAYDEQDKNVKIFPNPVTDELNIGFNNKYFVSFEIVDISGKTVHSSIIKKSENSIKLDTSQWNIGFYFILLKDVNGNIDMKKIVKAK